MADRDNPDYVSELELDVEAQTRRLARAEQDARRWKRAFEEMTAERDAAQAALADAEAENRQLRSNDMTAVMAITNLLNMRAHGVGFEYYARDTLAKIKPLLEGTVPAAAKGGK